MKKIAVEIKWGIVFFAVIILWTVFEKLMGWHDVNIEQHRIYSSFFALPAIAIYVLALIDKRKRDYGNKMTWVQGFMTGLIIAVIVAILSPLGQLLTHEYLSPEYFSNVIAYVVKTGEMNQVDAEAYFNLKSYIIMSIKGAIMMGVLTSAVVALFVRKK
ncbi:DUF4199 domain-containing protein [Carboxylicivirga sp. N1Y90]|uniref:DUF4199 domain-containing protein n=1 Tax=Carboxylicivirga fragile TaxID=3417571 RepID=UPI003D340645|nr:DUF4199 domain-containing protein [Marinilabiliaceae bacterium N1Y90]